MFWKAACSWGSPIVAEAACFWMSTLCVASSFDVDSIRFDVASVMIGGRPGNATVEVFEDAF